MLDTHLFFLIWHFNKFQYIFIEISPLYHSTPTAYWSWPRNSCTFRSQWSTKQLTWAGTGLRCAARPAWLQAGLCCAICAGQTQPTHFNRGGCRQLPLGTYHYSTCLAWPLSNCAVGSSHEIILEKQSCFLVRTLRDSSDDQKGELRSTNSICSPQHHGKNPFKLQLMLHEQGVPSIWRDARLSLSIFLFSFHLIKAGILLSHLSLSFPYWGPERALRQLSCTLSFTTTIACRSAKQTLV